MQVKNKSRLLLFVTALLLSSLVVLVKIPTVQAETFSTFGKTDAGAGSLTLNANPSGSSGSSGTIKYKIKIEVTHDGETLKNSIVHLSSKSTSVFESTGIDGVADFKVEKGVYTVEVYTDNLLTTLLYNGTITVIKAETFKIDINAQPETTPTSLIPIINVDLGVSPIILLIIIISAGAILVIILFSKKGDSS